MNRGRGRNGLCDGITVVLGVLERYVDHAMVDAPLKRLGNLTNYQVNNGYADVPEGVEAWHIPRGFRGLRWRMLADECQLG